MVVINCGNDSGSDGGGSDGTVIHSCNGDNRGVIIVAMATERKVEASTELASTEYIRTLPRSTVVS